MHHFCLCHAADIKAGDCQVIWHNSKGSASTVQQAKPGSIILLHVMIATKHVNVSTLSALADCPLE